MTSRRDFLSSAGMAILSAGFVSRAGAASLPEAAMAENATTQQPLMPPTVSLTTLLSHLTAGHCRGA